MIKYKKVIRRKEMFELTKRSKVRKEKDDRKKKFVEINFFNIPNFISSIIHKLNFFDFLVIGIVFFVVFYLLFDRIQRKEQWIDVRISVENSDWWYQGSPPKFWYASDLKSGDVAKDSYGSKVAEVKNIENLDIGGPYRNIFVDLKLKVVFDKNRNQFLYEYKPLTIGSSVMLNFSNQQLKGLVIGLGREKIDYHYKIVRLQKKSFQNITSAITNTNSVTSSVINKPVTPEFSEKIKVGDKSFDNNNELIAEILSIKKETSSYYEFSDVRGKNIKTYNPLYRDLEIDVKIRTYSISGLDFFIQAPIKIGSQIWVQFPKYSLEDYEIIEIIE
jgi:hypothetical protein